MNDSTIFSLEQLYGKSQVDVFVCDEFLNITWANDAAKQNPWFSDSPMPWRLSLIFPDVNFMSNAKMIAEGKMSYISCLYKHQVHLSFGFTPLGFNDEGRRYALAFRISSEEKESKLALSHGPDMNLLPAVSITSQPYRNAAFGIFNVISILANTFDKKDMYEELSYLNSLAYNCYSIMRTTINLNAHFDFVNNASETKMERVNINKFCRFLGENIAHILSSSNIEFSIDITDEEITTMADLGRLSIAVLNLVYNSCSYADLHPEISMLLKKQGNSYVITVTDNGIGIKQDLLPYVFDPFFTDISKAGTESTGLGLTITKEVAELLGGVCLITSEPYKGTTISIKCPIRDDLTKKCGLSVPPSPYLTRRMSLENIFLAEIGKYSAM